MEAPTNILPSQAHQEEEDEWDADGFVIPSLGMEDITNSICEPKPLKQKGVKEFKFSPQEKEIKKEEEIYLGPHGAPPPYEKKMYLSGPPHGVPLPSYMKRRIVEEGGGKKTGRMHMNKRKIYSFYR